MQKSSLRWSLSKLNTFEQCGKKYKFRYIDRVPEPPQPPGAAARGSAIHKAIEDYLKGEINELPSELSFYAGFLTQLKGAQLYPEHRMALNNDWEPVAPNDPTVWWTGILDLLIRPTEQLAVIYDWKTGKIWPDHEEQKEIYSIAVAATFPMVREVQFTHVYVDLGKNRRKTYHPDQLRSMRNKWEGRVFAAEHAAEYIPNPSFKCRFCPFSREKGGPCQF